MNLGLVSMKKSCPGKEGEMREKQTPLPEARADNSARACPDCDALTSALT